jgi:hypothetical protein
MKKKLYFNTNIKCTLICFKLFYHGLIEYGIHKLGQLVINLFGN